MNEEAIAVFKGLLEDPSKVEGGKEKAAASFLALSGLLHRAQRFEEGEKAALVAVDMYASLDGAKNKRMQAFAEAARFV